MKLRRAHNYDTTFRRVYVSYLKNAVDVNRLYVKL